VRASAARALARVSFGPLVATSSGKMDCRFLACLRRCSMFMLGAPVNPGNEWPAHSAQGFERESKKKSVADVHETSPVRHDQLPIEHWHAWLNDPTVADAILDRLIHRSNRIPLKGESMRKKPPLTPRSDTPS